MGLSTLAGMNNEKEIVEKDEFEIKETKKISSPFNFLKIKLFPNAVKKVFFIGNNDNNVIANSNGGTKKLNTESGKSCWLSTPDLLNNTNKLGKGLYYGSSPSCALYNNNKLVFTSFHRTQPLPSIAGVFFPSNVLQIYDRSTSEAKTTHLIGIASNADLSLPHIFADKSIFFLDDSRTKIYKQDLIKIPIDDLLMQNFEMPKIMDQYDIERETRRIMTQNMFLSRQKLYINIFQEAFEMGMRPSIELTTKRLDLIASLICSSQSCNQTIFNCSNNHQISTMFFTSAEEMVIIEESNGTPNGIHIINNNEQINTISINDSQNIFHKLQQNGFSWDFNEKMKTVFFGCNKDEDDKGFRTGVIDIKSGKTLPIYNKNIGSLCKGMLKSSPNGSYVVIATKKADAYIIKIFDLYHKSISSILKIKKSYAKPTFVGFSPEGSISVGLSTGELVLIKTELKDITGYKGPVRLFSNKNNRAIKNFFDVNFKFNN